MPENEQNDTEESFLDDYITTKRFGSKFWVKIVVFLFIVLFVFIFKTTVLDNKVEPEDLRSSIKIFDINSHWIVKEKVNETDFKGIVLVPEISFRIKNIGDKDLQYVLMVGVFRFMYASKPIGEGYRMLFNEPFAPGQESETIVVTSPFGYRATSAQAVDKNQRNWRSSLVEIYVKSRNSGLLPIETYYINRKIEGIDDIEVKVM